ncbi:hypothetical protein PVAND_017647 [Polypedilum vanderplanki]|uniref:K Homology domain-containing protein n=1 Tax=Polypedilum vanderplanki TaxID=319348 RepID=A0A9J6B904_POLVA|nr:hypothetical protein PVAND_017647 [Polypedilum vanderplanki]
MKVASVLEEKIGQIIGFRGRIINDITKEHNVKINLTKKEGKYRVIKMKGEMKNIIFAIETIIDHVGVDNILIPPFLILHIADNIRNSSEIDLNSPKAATKSPAAAKISPGVATLSPGVATLSPGVDTISPGVDTISPGVDKISPEVFKNLPGVSTSSVIVPSNMSSQATFRLTNRRPKMNITFDAEDFANFFGYTINKNV